jgi:1,4-alpha-glucan branching enzyme
VSIRQGQLVPCDPGGERADIGDPPPLTALARNNQLVIYELPSSWSRAGVEGSDPSERDVGTFRDVLALLDPAEPGANFSDLAEVSARQHLVDLGINALELLPIADTKARREWGYATAHYLAPDQDLGWPDGNVSSTASMDLTALVQTCHAKGIRLFSDVVMAFGHDPYARGLNFPDFHIAPNDERDNPDSYQSSRNRELRAGFGGENWRYGSRVQGCDPETGTPGTIQPASSFMFTFLERWMRDFHVDGFRRDSVNNVANWDFLKAFATRARAQFHARYPSEPNGDVDARFLVVDEELSVPLDLLTTGTTDALWNEHFRRRVRAAIVGESEGGDDFEWTVRKMVDCRLLGFADLAQAVIYLGNHDTAGYRQERLYDFLESSRVYDKERRAKLAFVCLLTSVGIPMIFAGDEFVDQQDRPATDAQKQIDPVDFSRMRDGWRRNVFRYVSNLVRFRIRSPALGTNPTEFIHFDFEQGRRIAAWVRGDPATQDPVVVVANFSDSATPGPEYIVNNWPLTPQGKKWREITQGREVPQAWVAREPLYGWEAKVYERYS